MSFGDNCLLCPLPVSSWLLKRIVHTPTVLFPESHFSVNCNLAAVSLFHWNHFCWSQHHWPFTWQKLQRTPRVSLICLRTYLYLTSWGYLMQLTPPPPPNSSSSASAVLPSNCHLQCLIYLSFTLSSLLSQHALLASFICTQRLNFQL